MSLIQIYQCLCDPTRLRILNLLQGGELCVCHIQEILNEPQVKISKHLAYLRKRGLVQSRKEANWMIYRLPAKPVRELSANLACLQDCISESPVFRKDSAKRAEMSAQIAAEVPVCCAPVPKRARTAKLVSS
jgi:ArsR family transcriptional regulator, arsenate/arsenite/antimonite-responsive transcriptional repressor